LPTIPSPTSDSHQPAQLPAISKSMDRHPLEPVRTAVHDTVVDVLVSYNHDSSEGSMGQPGRSRGRKPNSPLHTNAQMMISVWRGNEGEQCFTLTFTATAPIFDLSSAVRLVAVFHFFLAIRRFTHWCSSTNQRSSTTAQPRDCHALPEADENEGSNDFKYGERVHRKACYTERRE
jgi:hypothetical protein